jgi:DNA-binding NtrC family response regulator
MINSNGIDREPGQKHVLILDDNQQLVEFLAVRCRSIGLAVWTATNADDAAEIIDQGSPDLLILDVDLQAYGDDSFLQFLDTQEAEWNVPVIAMCKSADLDSAYRVKNLCTYYVHKSPKVWNKIKLFSSELVDLTPSLFGQAGDENNFQTDIL